MAGMRHPLGPGALLAGLAAVASSGQAGLGSALQGSKQPGPAAKGCHPGQASAETFPSVPAKNLLPVPCACKTQSSGQRGRV